MREKLSEFLDGELDHADSLQLIKQLGKDEELRRLWHRYHVYGSVLRDETTTLLSADFSSRVAEALADEPVQLAPAAIKQRRRLTGPFAGLAVAASLVGIAVLLVKPGIQEESQPGVTTVAETTSPAADSYSTSPGTYREQDLIVANSKNENVRERINRLLVEHNEYNPAGDMTGMMPYSRFVGYNPSTDRR